MGNSAPVPPDDGEVPEGDDLDEAEMTSIMDAEQRRELQRAARAAQKEPERETARPPPEAVIAVEAEVVIPKAAAIPAEALPREPASQPTAEPAAARHPPLSGEPTPSNTWFVLAFVLLAAAIAFAMR